MFIQPSEHNTYADIEAVYECLQTEYGVSQEDLILYGQSVGSGPTLHLAAQLPRLRGVVLHSAILSGLRVLCHVKFTLCFDIYRVSSHLLSSKCDFSCQNYVIIVILHLLNFIQLFTFWVYFSNCISFFVIPDNPKQCTSCEY